MPRRFIITDQRLQKGPSPPPSSQRDTHHLYVMAKAIRMDLAGGLAVIHAGLIYVADYGYKCIWKITIG